MDYSIWLIAFIGGLVGSVFMDITEARMAKMGISSGVNAAYIGRWVYGLLKGTVYHKNIQTTVEAPNEIRIGIWFHFIIGGGAVALFYPICLLLLGMVETQNHLWLAILFGLATSVLPWFILMPSFGWGWFGARSPVVSRPILAPLLSHIAFGLGLGLVFWVSQQF